MKHGIAFILMGLALGLHADGLAPVASPDAAAQALTATPVAAPAPEIAQIVESHFQSARGAYLAGDRDRALSELNEALRLDPYHPGCTQLYETIREEEKGLRQVRLLPPADDAAPKAQAADGGQAAAPSNKLWQGLRNFESRTNAKLESVEKQVSQVGEDLNGLRQDLGSQKQTLSQLAESEKKVESRQDSLMIAMLGFLFILILLLIMAVRSLSRMREDLGGVESRLHEHPGQRVRR